MNMGCAFKTAVVAVFLFSFFDGVHACGANPPLARPLQLSVPEEVDIRQCPKTGITTYQGTYSEQDFVTVGDLHGNFSKLIFFLAKEALVSFADPADCQTLLNFYHNRNNSVPDLSLQVPVPDPIKKIIGGMKIKRPPEVPNVRLIGDELADRGKSDALTIEVLKKLHEAQPGFEIMVSNHGIEFLREMRGLPRVLFLHQTRSIDPILNLRTDGSNASRQSYLELQRFVDEVYLQHLKLVSATNGVDGVTVFTHAPTEPKRIAWASSQMGILDPNCGRGRIETQIFNCVKVMNEAYISGIRNQNPMDSKSFLNRNVSSGAGDGRENRVEVDFLADLFWMRHTEQRFLERDRFRWRTANGHDTVSPGARNASTFELDTDLGKGDGEASIGTYLVLRPI